MSNNNLTIEERFEKLSVSRDFSKVENKLSNKLDLHVILKLEQLIPNNKHDNIISYATHDTIYFAYTDEELSVLTDDDIVELSLCGILYDEGLMKFV